LPLHTTADLITIAVCGLETIAVRTIRCGRDTKCSIFITTADLLLGIALFQGYLSPAQWVAVSLDLYGRCLPIDGAADLCAMTRE
jgi:hypothetical protein